MARISVTVANGHYRVTVRGRLTHADLRRLERMCGPALEHRALPLEIRLVDPMEPHEAASFYLGRLRARGAVIVAAARPAMAPDA